MQQGCLNCLVINQLRNLSVGNRLLRNLAQSAVLTFANMVAILHRVGHGFRTDRIERRDSSACGIGRCVVGLLRTLSVCSEQRRNVRRR